MVNVFINAAHTSFSPGAMIYGRTEHSDVLAFARMLSMELERYEGIKCEYYTGNCRKGYSDEDIVIILHRGSNSGNDNTYGCDITVKAPQMPLLSMMHSGFFRVWEEKRASDLKRCM